MAYITLSHRDFDKSRLERLARALGIEATTATGHVVWLYHNAQKAEVDRGCAAELAVWALFPYSDSRVDVFARALADLEYVTPVGTSLDGTVFEIRDMGRQRKNLERSRGKRERWNAGASSPAAPLSAVPASSSGVVGSWGEATPVIDVEPVVSEDVVERIGDAPTTSIAIAKTESDQAQMSVNDFLAPETSDSSSVVAARRPRQKTARVSLAVPKEKTPGQQVWEAFELAFFIRYKLRLPRSAKSSSICTNLVKQFGVDDAKGIVDYYLSRHDARFVAARHPLDMCAKNAHQMLTDLQLGDKMTFERAKRVEAHSSTTDAITSYMERQGGSDGSEAIP